MRRPCPTPSSNVAQFWDAVRRPESTGGGSDRQSGRNGIYQRWQLIFCKSIPGYVIEFKLVFATRTKIEIQGHRANR